MNKHLHNSLRALFLSLAVLLSLPMLAAQVEIDGINYDFDAETKKATVIAKSSGKYSGEVVIPESVEHEGTAYSVTSIGWYAFRYCQSLTSVTFGNSVKSIERMVFQYCDKLKDVYCYAEDVPQTYFSDEYGYGYAFSLMGSVTLLVPAASIDRYKATYPWSSFGNIVALTE